MSRFGFHVASAEEIKEGQTTDVYFVRTQQILKAKGLDRRRAYAEFTVGELPLGWPWGIFCGLEEVVHLLEGLPIDVEALPEGTLFPARDAQGVRVPVLGIEGPYGSFCLYETPVLGMICQATGVATKAGRLRSLAGSAQILAFGVRRMHPAIAPMLDRASYLGGCDGVSSLCGGRAIGKPPMGTMPHALIVAFGDQRKAWGAFDEVMPSSVPRIALVDTYSDEKQETLWAAEVLGKRLAGVRLDTPSSRRGNLSDLVREIRWELDLRGYRSVRIFVSGGIDEEEVPSLLKAGVGGFGIGTAISNAPTVDLAMDIVQIDHRPCAKRGKFGGRKVPYRCPRCWSVEVRPAGQILKRSYGKPRCPSCRGPLRPLFKKVLKAGKRVETLPTVDTIRRYVLDQLKRQGTRYHFEGGFRKQKVPVRYQVPS